MFASYSTTKRASPGVEPGTFRTQSEDNAISNFAETQLNGR